MLPLTEESIDESAMTKFKQNFKKLLSIYLNLSVCILHFPLHLHKAKDSSSYLRKKVGQVVTLQYKFEIIEI